jgi:thiol-disulfide isomerase/thioredoxin
MKINVKLLWLIAFFMVAGNVLKSQEINRKIMDPKLNEEILYGYCNRNGLEEGEFGKVFKEYYSIYEPDKEVMGVMRSKLDSVSILIVLGTWCSDSQEQVPKFFKVLDKIRFNEKNLTIICVSKDKEAGEIDVKKYDIQRVPTFIIFRGSKEVGRIIETPVTSLEKDLLMLLGD